MSSPSSRMLELLSLLQVRREWAGDVLATRLEVSPRTVRRDIERLRELGYRIDASPGPAGGYQLSAGSELPPLLFDDEQAVAVALALAVAPASGADIAEAATRALATVRQVMPSRLRHRVDAVDVLATPGGAVVDPEVLVAVSEATRAHEVLRFDYASASASGSDGERASRSVEPHAVVARNGRWYLLAWDDEAEADAAGSDAAESDGAASDGAGSDGAEFGETRRGAPAAHGDWRTYRIDRISPRSPTRRPFAPRPIPGGDPVAFVAARFRGSESADWPCVGTAVIRLPARRIAPYIDADASIDEIDPLTTSLTMGSWSWRALAARFAGFDADFEIVRPAELREGALELGRRLANLTPKSAS